MGLKCFESYRLGTHNFFSESHLGLRILPSFHLKLFDAKKNVSCSTSTKKTHSALDHDQNVSHFSELPFDAKNVSCSTSTKKTHLHHVSHRENWRSSLCPVGDAAVHCAQLSSPELPAACKCKTWQPLLVV